MTADLAAAMCVLRDQQGLTLADQLIRQAARDSEGTVESLASRFRLAGRPQAPDVLVQLVRLREDAVRGLAGPISTPTAPGATGPRPAVVSQPRETNGLPAGHPTPPPPPAAAAPVAPADGWSPPAWYQAPDKDEEAEAPQAGPPQAVPEPPAATTAAGPPSWYAQLQREEAEESPAATQPPAAQPVTQPAVHPPTAHPPAAPPPAAAQPAPRVDPPQPRTDPVAPGWTEPRHAYPPAPGVPATQQPPSSVPPPGNQQPSVNRQPLEQPRAEQPRVEQPAAVQQPAAQPSAPPALPAFTEQMLPSPELVSSECDAFETRDHRLQMRSGQGRITVKWPPNADGPGATVYLVCASPSQVPELPDDGSRLLVTLLNQVTLPADAGRFFAVFAYQVSRPEELSYALGIRHALGRVLLEVEDLEVTAEEHGVLLGWTRPAGVDRVRVMRSEPDQPLPAGPNPSLLVPFTGDTFRDADVQPGATYVYRIYTESRPLIASDGSAWESSPGQVREVRVPGRPEPVTDLAAVKEVRVRRAGVNISWLRPVRGTVRLYMAPGEPSVETVLGVSQTAEQFAVQEPLLGKRLREPIQQQGERDVADWVPLDTQADEGRYSRWTVTAVTIFAETFVIGAHQVVSHVGDIDEVDLDERVDWQLLRSSWPTGATFLGLWQVAPGEPPVGPPHQRFTRDEFDVHGGLLLRLGPYPVDLLVQGAVKYGPSFVVGGVRKIAYQGRWVVRYELPAAGRFGGTRRLQVMVERPDWPDLSFLLIADRTGFPLRSNAPTVTTVAQGQLPGSALPPGQYVPAIPELKPPRDAATRMIAWSSAGVPTIVLDPLDPPSDRPPVPSAPGLHCPRCLRISDLSVQHFRCQGSCQPVADGPMTQLLHPGTTDPALTVRDRPVFPVIRTTHAERNVQVLDPPVNSAPCPRPDCQQVSHQHVCPHCHTTLPPNWWANDVLGVVMIGARSSGKTTYLSALMKHLERNLLPRMNGHLHPMDPESEVKLAGLRAGMHAGELAAGTLGAAQNESLLRPMVASLGTGSSGRERTLSLFDVAGEDMSRAETVRPYVPALTGADLIVLLIDPLQLDGVREWLEGTVPLPAKGDPAVTVVRNVVQEIRGYRGIATGPLPQRVAVTFAKFDGLQEAAAVPQSGVGGLIGPGNALWRDPYPLSPIPYHQPDGRRVHDEVRALLLGMGETSLVSLVESSFREVQYFAVSALGHGPRGRQMTTAGASPQRVGDPLRWLLWLARWEG